MNKIQLEHYLKGGKFIATYVPEKTSDLDLDCLMQVNNKIEVFQNINVAPQIGEPYEGQHCFNTSAFRGWLPEQDIQDFLLVNEFIDNPQSLPRYVYILIYEEWSQVEPNFGLGDWKVPLVVSREYDRERDDYVIYLSDPQATEIRKSIWSGGEFDWKVIYGKSK